MSDKPKISHTVIMDDIGETPDRLVDLVDDLSSEMMQVLLKGLEKNKDVNPVDISLSVIATLFYDFAEFTASYSEFTQEEIINSVFSMVSEEQKKERELAKSH